MIKKSYVIAMSLFMVFFQVVPTTYAVEPTDNHQSCVNTSKEIEMVREYIDSLQNDVDGNHAVPASFGSVSSYVTPEQGLELARVREDYLIYVNNILGCEAHDPKQKNSMDGALPVTINEPSNTGKTDSSDLDMVTLSEKRLTP